MWGWYTSPLYALTVLFKIDQNHYPRQLISAMSTTKRVGSNTFCVDPSVPQFNTWTCHTRWWQHLFHYAPSSGFFPLPFENVINEGDCAILWINQAVTEPTCDSTKVCTTVWLKQGMDQCLTEARYGPVSDWIKVWTNVWLNQATCDLFHRREVLTCYCYNRGCFRLDQPV